MIAKPPSWLGPSRTIGWLMQSDRIPMPSVARHFSTVFHRTIPVFGGGGVSAVAMSISLAAWFGSPALKVWAGLELALFLGRIAIAWKANRAAPALPRYFDNEVLSELAGAASIGFGSVAAMLTADPVGLMLGWVSAIAFASEACIRHLGSQRLILAMIAIGVFPSIATCLASGNPLLTVAGGLAGLFVGQTVLATERFAAVLDETMHAERESDHRARHDRLTGLLNLAGLERELELMRSERLRAGLTLFFIDLDDFKQVNDTYGHAVGDQLLRDIAERLLTLVGPRDIAARIGGDEFIVVSALDLVEPEEFGAALIAAISSVPIADSAKSVTASVGAADGPANEIALTELMRTADQRLYRAKHAGGARCETTDKPVD